MSDAIISISPATLYNLGRARAHWKNAREWQEYAGKVEKSLKTANNTIRQQKKVISSLREEVKQLKAELATAKKIAIEQSALAAGALAQRNAVRKNRDISWDEVKKIGNDAYDAELKKAKSLY